MWDVLWIVILVVRYQFMKQLTEKRNRYQVTRHIYLETDRYEASLSLYQGRRKTLASHSRCHIWFPSWTVPVYKLRRRTFPARKICYIFLENEKNCLIFRNISDRCSISPVCGLSVPASWVTWYWRGVNLVFRSFLRSSDIFELLVLSVAVEDLLPLMRYARKQTKQSDRNVWSCFLIVYEACMISIQFSNKLKIVLLIILLL